MRLLVNAKEISLGEIVRATETDFAMVECFDAVQNQCRIITHCRLKDVLNQATESYLAVLDGVTLADLVAPVASSGNLSVLRRMPLVPGLPSSTVRAVISKPTL
jgi:Rrf2 family nitric oxide-sensitive transcriptional repressor